MSLFKGMWQFFDRLRMDRRAFLRKYQPRLYALLREIEEEECEAAFARFCGAERRVSNGA